VLTAETNGKTSLFCCGTRYGERRAGSCVPPRLVRADANEKRRRERLKPDDAPTSLAGRIYPREMAHAFSAPFQKTSTRRKKEAADKQDSSERVAKRRQETSGFGLRLWSVGR
jgi:hypothetical protein